MAIIERGPGLGQKHCKYMGQEWRVFVCPRLRSQPLPQPSTAVRPSIPPTLHYLFSTARWPNQLEPVWISIDLPHWSINIPPASPENSQINNSKWIMPLLLSTSKLNSGKQLKWSQGTMLSRSQQYSLWYWGCPKVLFGALKFKMLILDNI